MSYSPRKWRQKHEQHEFLPSLSNHVSVVTVAGKFPGNRKICDLMKMGRQHENMSSGDVTQIISGTKKICIIADENGRKHEKYDFWRRHSNHVSVITIARNCLEKRKLYASR
jgi:hypothetical protein